MTSTDTPRTDACPHCGAEISIPHKGGKPRFYKCQSRIGGSQTRPLYCREREKSQKLEAEVERLTSALKSCWWATNTYDGNYAKACDNVATIVTNALKTQDNK